MFETPFAMVGNVVTDPVARRVGEGEVIRFRVASSSRKRTAEGTWEPGNSLFVTVSCWGRVAEGVAGVIIKGDPVVVVGHVYTSDYDDKEGNRRSSIEVRAISVGPDLARCKVKIDPSKRSPLTESVVDSGPDSGPDGLTSEESTAEAPNNGLPLSA
jgi:single-strand DNA-binding protein